MSGPSGVAHPHLRPVWVRNSCHVTWARLREVITSIWNFFLTLLQIKQPTGIQGNLSLKARTVGLIGRDQSHAFGATFKLANGSPLPISPTDLICQIRI